MWRSSARSSVFFLALLCGLAHAAETEPETGEPVKKDARDIGPDSIDVSGYPPEMQEAYAVFSKKCSKCHTLARPINARVSDAEWWKEYVRKMMRKPGSGINQNTGKDIYRFLVYYQERKAEAREKKEAE